MMFVVVLNYRHPPGEEPAFSTETLLADRVDITRDAILVSWRGEREVLDLPASARDEQVCTALGEPSLWSISVEHQPRRSSHRRPWRDVEGVPTRHGTGSFDAPGPVPAHPGAVR